MKPLVASLLAILAAASVPGAQTAAPVTLDQLLARTGAFVVEFKARFVSVVAEERYEQFAPRPTGASTQTAPGPVARRILTSDFLLVKVPGDDRWLPFPMCSRWTASRCGIARIG